MKKPSQTLELIIEFTKNEFYLRYKKSILGLFWVLLKPFLSFLIIYFVFSHFFASSDSSYLLNLLLGIILFQFFSESTLRGITSLLDRSSLIQKTSFNRATVVASPLLSAILNLIFSFIIFLVFWLVSRPQFSWYWLLSPLYLIIFALFVYGFSLIASIVNVKIRDLAVIWEILLGFIFYLTPIIYPLSLIPQKFQPYFYSNPLFCLLDNLRRILIQGVPPDLKTTLYLLILSATFLFLGIKYFKKNISKIIEEI